MKHNTKIKIAFFIDSMNSIAGTEKQILNIIEHLDSNRFKVYLFALRPPSARFKMDGLNFNYFELNVGSLLSLKSFLSLFHTRKLLKRFNIDIVQTFFIDGNIYGVICAKISGIKKIIVSRRDLGFWYNNKILLLLNFINKFATHFLVNSYAVKNNIIKYEKVKPSTINVIYNGINNTVYNNNSIHRSKQTCYHQSDFYIGSNNKNNLNKQNYQSEKCISADNLVVGTVANFSRIVKRVDVFIQSASILCNRYNNLQFVIIGGGYLENQLKLLVEELKISDKCSFLGIQSDVLSIIKNWDIGVITSESEGFCNSILEYMVAGLPVVATDVGGNQELVANNISGYLVPPNSPDEISDAISILVENPSLRMKMGKRGKFHAQTNYNWENISKEYQRYYYQILTG